MKKIGVAIFGLGVVGGGTYEILTKNHDYFLKTQGIDITIEAVLEINKDRLRSLNVPKEKVANSIMEVVSNPNVDIVVETIGGVTIAKDLALTALRNGKTVVSANKELFAKHWDELQKVAIPKNAGIYMEASCVGGVPIIRTLIDGTNSNKIESIIGIINGTTNYILSKMSDCGASYKDVLKEAQSLGYAEANPSADVEGYDASYKLSILASLAFQTKIPLSVVYREGIENIKVEDIKIGKEFGYTLKLLGIGKQTPNGIEVRVHPTFIKAKHPLANISGAYNAVHLVGDSVGDIMLYGAGAGALPTGSAIVSDIIYAAKNLEFGHYYPSFRNENVLEDNVVINTNFESSYYIRMTVADKVGVLSKIGNVFAETGVSIADIIQRGDGDNGVCQLVVTTHLTEEQRVQKSIEVLSEMPNVVSKVEAVIRIEK